MSQPA